MGTYTYFRWCERLACRVRSAYCESDSIVGLRIIYNVWRDTKCHRTERGNLSDLNNNLTPCMAGQNLVIRTEHVVEIVNRIDDRLDIACTKEFPVYRESVFEVGVAHRP